MEWATGGSLALALQGLPVVPIVVLQTDRVGAEPVAQLPAEHLIHPPVLRLGVRLIRAYMPQLKYGLEVEVIGNLEFQSSDGRWSPAPNFRQKRSTVDHLGLSIPVVSLEFLLAFYTQLQRPGRAALIKAQQRPRVRARISKARGYRLQERCSVGSPDACKGPGRFFRDRGHAPEDAR